MFDLFRKSEKTKKYFMGGILLFVSASMLLYLVPNYNTGSSASDPVVAQIGRDTLTENEVRQQLQTQLKGTRIPPEVIPNYIPGLIDKMITERALEWQAAKLGLQVTDQDVADAIRVEYSSLFPDGKFVGKDVYAAMLAQQNMTIEQFEADLKRQLLINRLREVALQATIVTPAEIEADYRKKNEQAKIDYVKLVPDKFRKEAEPSADEMERYFKLNAAQYTIPEKKSLVVLEADQTKLEQAFNPTDAQLLTAYNLNQANFRMPERVHARHILLMTQGKPASDDAKIKAKAEDLLKQLRAGGDFAELAKKNSEDPGSAPKGGDLDWVTRGQMVPEFEKATFALKPGQISDVVKTQYGYHIIQSVAHEDARLKPFAEVKDDLAKQWKAQQVGDRMQQISDKVQSILQKDPNNPDKVAADLGMTVVRTNTADISKDMPELAGNSEFDQSISGLKKGEVSQSVALASNTKVVAAEVTDVVPARPATFDEVKQPVHDRLAAGRLNNLLQQKAAELANAAKANGGDLAKAARAMGLEVKASDPFKRSATVENLGSASYLEDAFKAPVGTVLNPIGMAEWTVVAKVVQHIDADMSGLAAQRSQIRDSLKGEKARDRENLFEAGVLDQLTRQGVLKKHTDVIKRIISSYSSSS